MNNETIQLNPQPTNNSNTKLVWAVVISVIVTALVVGLGVYAWQQSVQQKQMAVLQQSSQVTPQASASVLPTGNPTTLPIATANATANWATYTSPKDGYQIQYPTEFAVKPQTFYSVRDANVPCTKITTYKDPNATADAFVMINATSAAATCETADLLTMYKDSPKVQQKIMIDGTPYTANGVQVRNPRDNDFNYYQLVVGNNTISFGVSAPYISGKVDTAKFATLKDTVVKIVESYTMTTR